MDGAFDYLQGLGFYSGLAAIAVMAGVWYFWWHVLPKIKKYDQSQKILEVIVPKIGEDIDSLEKNFKTLKTSITEVIDILGKEFDDVNQRSKYYSESFEELFRIQKSDNRRILDEISKLRGKSLFKGEVEVGFDSREEVSRPVGSDTERIMDEMTLEDIRGIIRNDQTLYEKFDGDERRSNIDRRSGRERRQTRTNVRDDRRMTKRRSGTDRREENTLGYLKKLSSIVDVLQDDPHASAETLRRRSRIHDF